MIGGCLSGPVASRLLHLHQLLCTATVPVMLSEPAHVGHTTGAFEAVHIVKIVVVVSGVGGDGEVFSHPASSARHGITGDVSAAAIRASFGVDIGISLQHSGSDGDGGESGSGHAAASFSVIVAVTPATVWLLILEPAMFDELPCFAGDFCTGEYSFAECQHCVLSVAGITATRASTPRIQLVSPVSGRRGPGGFDCVPAVMPAAECGADRDRTVRRHRVP